MLTWKILYQIKQPILWMCLINDGAGTRTDVSVILYLLITWYHAIGLVYVAEQKDFSALSLNLSLASCIWKLKQKGGCVRACVCIRVHQNPCLAFLSYCVLTVVRQVTCHKSRHVMHLWLTAGFPEYESWKDALAVGSVAYIWVGHLARACLRLAYTHLGIQCTTLVRDFLAAYPTLPWACFIFWCVICCIMCYSILSRGLYLHPMSSSTWSQN